MLELVGLRKTFGRPRDGTGRVVAVDGVSLSIEAGELFTLLGPSGCGKTTTLRCIAGLETPDEGEISLGGALFFSSTRRVDVPPNERGLGMVFQSYAIWPHMNVFDNIAFPLTVAPRRSRLPRREIRARVERVLSVIQLDVMAGRPATDLSGGQQQRLALARALVMEPPMLLLDEPLSNLDARLREEMRFELRRVQQELGVTTVYVTHDQTEALAMSSRIAVLQDGRLEQLGTPREIYQRPHSRFVADFIGAANLIHGEIAGLAPDGRYLVTTPGGTLRAASAEGFGEGHPVTVIVRPEHVALTATPGGDGTSNGWHGVVEAHAYLGDAVDHVVRVGTLRLRARGEPSVVLPPGAEVSLRLDASAFTLVRGG